jgi:hypothetical protein
MKCQGIVRTSITDGKMLYVNIILAAKREQRRELTDLTAYMRRILKWYLNCGMGAQWWTLMKMAMVLKIL